ncbi:hypothetical protein J3S90_12050 [Flavobacterium sp. P4023]|uniref:Outer membrane protein beta-barrel domain-containing protein n=1 Tax=Flavobacterium flabelliforme TaxID=2816119 RepID=A0ABS5CVA2_9FLAO|nr:hypothetical protein [Flavobacterium flabelliforme]MBP4142535.1 hypothetical protein [Flavobacterium flabelliforme]
MKLRIFYILFMIPIISNAQNKYYSYNFYEGKGYLFTMNQSNDLMLNSIRYIGGSVNDKYLSEKEKKLYSTGLSLFTGLLGQAITHEEGHRSVLSELGIGSISKPLFDKHLVAKVTGVSDQTLMNLRDSDLSDYIRLHTAGLESDYAYLKKSDAFLNFNEEKNEVLYPDYIMRKLGTQFYYLTNLFTMKPGIKEEDDPELERDIVGHDLYGMIRHLHRPTMEFYRYTERGDLTTEEKAYARRMGYMSFFNFLNPNIWKRIEYNLSKEVEANFSVNYSLAPFGDFVEQNVYLTIKGKYKINPYFRQYFNKSYTFLAGGINLHNYTFRDGKFLLNSSIDFWEQPKNLEFRNKEGKFGFGLRSEFAVRFSNWNTNTKSAYFNLGASYKTDGFIPESPSLKEDFRIHLGFVLAIKE